MMSFEVSIWCRWHEVGDYQVRGKEGR
jgi:hypothetical protein